MEKDDVLSGLVMELRRGTLVLCVLSQLKEPKYGYHLISTLAEAGTPIEANTLYPLLRRLEGQGLLQSSWQTDGSKPRKYYESTDLGNAVYQELKQIWQDSVKNVNKLLEDK